MTRLLLQNIKLFFLRPKELFLQLKETPDLKNAAVLLLINVLTLSLPKVKLVVSKCTDITCMLLVLVSAMIFMGAVVSAGQLWISFYTLLFCRIFRSRPKFTAILSSMIYCGIPIIIASLLYTLLPFKTDLLSVIATDTVHPFLKEVLRSVEPFRLWMAVMEIIAVAIVAGIDYLKSFMIVFSYWAIEIIVIYFYGL